MSETSAEPAKKLLRVVIDTNLFVRALLRSRVAEPLLEGFVSDRFQLITSEPLLDELAEVLSRPKIRRVVPESDSAELLRLILQRAIAVTPSPDPPDCRDPDDRVFLACAIAGQAQYLVTGDGDRLADPRLRAEMSSFGVEIVAIEDFLARLTTAPEES